MLKRTIAVALLVVGAFLTTGCLTDTSMSKSRGFDSHTPAEGDRVEAIRSWASEAIEIEKIEQDVAQEKNRLRNESQANISRANAKHMAEQAAIANAEGLIRSETVRIHASELGRLKDGIVEGERALQDADEKMRRLETENERLRNR